MSRAATNESQSVKPVKANERTILPVPLPAGVTPITFSAARSDRRYEDFHTACSLMLALSFKPSQHYENFGWRDSADGPLSKFTIGDLS